MPHLTYDAHFHLPSLKENAFDAKKYLTLFGDHRIGLLSSATYQDWDTLLSASVLFPEMDLGLGIHPYDVRSLGIGMEVILRLLETYLCRHPKVCAISEIGLDLTYPNLESQINSFNEQIALANAYQLPIIVHCVRAFHIVMRIFRSNFPRHGFVFHGFSGSEAIADWILERGGYLSLGTYSLHPRSKVCRYLRKLPLERILVETDAPFEGKYWKNPDRKATLEDVLCAISAEKQCPIDDVSSKILNNSQTLFRKDRSSKQRKS